MAARGTSISRRKVGRVLRPIERVVTSEDRIAADLFALSNQGKFIKGPDAQNNLFSTASAGSKVGPSLGGGVFSPASPTAGHVTQNGNTAPVYPS